VKCVVQIEEMREMHTNVESEGLKEIAWETLGKDIRMLLKWILSKHL
jgi:hypothetical protein